ncbi:MAG: hypothetical protein CMQ24_17905 [Gammaproteobacteria bacterium]|nr:hypothetical protein [Gammaproteobacteria bacterium]
MRLLQIGSGSAAEYAGLLASELGFSVDRVPVATEPDGDPADTRARELFLSRGKRDVNREGLSFADYDAIVEDVGPAALRGLGITWTHLHAQHPGLALVSVSPFGASGPYANWHATDLTAQAAGGVVHVSGRDGEPPRALPQDVALMIAGLHAATAALSTTYAVAAGTETGVHVDISAQDTLMHHWTRHVADYAYCGMTTRRHGEQTGIEVTGHVAPAADGLVFVHALRQPWQDVAAFLGLGEFLTESLMQPGAEQPWDAMAGAFEDAVAARSRYDWCHDAADLGWTFAPVEDPWAVLSGPQNGARGSTDEASTDEGLRTRLPGVPWRFEDQL